MTESDNNPQWFLCRPERPGAKARLFCLPFAGGGASTYSGWAREFPDEIELRAVQPPGREWRLNEVIITDAVPLVSAITDSLEPLLERPFALFGYSMGAMIAFEISRELRRRELRMPIALFVSSRRAPHVPDIHEPLSNLPMDELLSGIRQIFEPPTEAWDIPELAELLLPILQSDVSLCDRYVHLDEAPLSCPIYAFVGDSDRSAPLATVEEWHRHTTAKFSVQVFPGGHFFLNDSLSDLQQIVRRELLGILAGTIAGV